MRKQKSYKYRAMQILCILRERCYIEPRKTVPIMIEGEFYGHARVVEDGIIFHRPISYNGLAILIGLSGRGHVGMVTRKMAKLGLITLIDRCLPRPTRLGLELVKEFRLQDKTLIYNQRIAEEKDVSIAWSKLLE